MKIVMISFGFFDYVIQLANALSKKETVFLILPKNKISKMQKRRINKRVIRKVVYQPKRRYPTNLLMVYRIKRTIDGIKPDIIHFQYGYIWTLFILSFMKKYGIITTIHDVKEHPGEESLEMKFIHFIIRKFSNKIILHGNKLKKIFVKIYDYKKPIYVIPHGNFEVYKGRKKFKEQKNWILFFGRIWEYKGLKYLIEAEPLIREKIKNFKIVIAGRGEDFGKYNKMIRNKESFLIYNEYIPEKKMAELFQKASVVVLPYIEASQSGVIPIAYQFKKPVISTDVGALSDVLINNKTGLLIEPRKVKKLADSIVYLLRRPKLRKQMGKAGYKFAKEQLSWDKIANQTIQAYKNTIYNKNKIVRKHKSILYLTWLEKSTDSVRRSQVIEVLKEIKRSSPKDRIYLLAFQPVHKIIPNCKNIHNLRKELKEHDISLITIPIFKFIRGWAISWLYLAAFPITLLVTLVKKIDIVHCRGYSSALIAILVKKFRKNLKIIFDPRSPFPEECVTAKLFPNNSRKFKKWKRRERKILKKTDITIAITNSCREHYKKISPNAKFAIIGNNTDVREYKFNKNLRGYYRSKMGISKDELIFCYSGSMGNNWNNPVIYAKFLIQLRKLNLKHRFLFLTPNVNNLQEIFNEYEIKSNEYFAIALDMKDVSNYLNIADFGLNLMSKKDIRMSIKTADYLSMGIPIITNLNVLGAKEIIDQYKVGLVLPDLKNINMKKLKNFIANKDYFNSKTRKVALSNFSTSKVATKYIGVYKKLMKDETPN